MPNHRLNVQDILSIRRKRGVFTSDIAEMKLLFEIGRANSRDHRQMYKKGVSPVTFEDRVKNAKQRQRDIRHKLLAKARSLMLMQRHNSDGAESSMHVEIDNCWATKAWQR